MHLCLGMIYIAGICTKKPLICVTQAAHSSTGPSLQGRSLLATHTSTHTQVILNLHHHTPTSNSPNPVPPVLISYVYTPGIRILVPHSPCYWIPASASGALQYAFRNWVLHATLLAMFEPRNLQPGSDDMAINPILTLQAFRVSSGTTSSSTAMSWRLWRRWGRRLACTPAVRSSSTSLKLTSTWLPSTTGTPQNSVNDLLYHIRSI